MNFKKTKVLVACVICIFTFTLVNAEDVPKYMRSSLHMVLIDKAAFDIPEKKDAVLNAWKGAEFPNKYNNHTIASMTQMEPIEGKNSEFPVAIEAYIKKTKLANKLVEKWYGWSDEKKSFSMDLVAERGFYNASELDAGIAKGATMGRAKLADAGENLIKNTFVTFTECNFISNEVPAKIAFEAAKLAASKLPLPPAQTAAIKAAEAAYNIMKEGYSVVANTWLYQLNWDETVQNEFYNKLWSDKQAFDNSEIFTMKLIGNSKTLRLTPINPKRTQEQNIAIGTVRTFDRTFVDLQRENPVFMPMIPITSVDPITADIGSKESLEGGEKFELLEMLKDENGLTSYEVVGKTTVLTVKNNEFNAGEEPVPAVEGEAKEGKDKKVEFSDATTFKKVKKAQPGMLLKQVK